MSVERAGVMDRRRQASFAFALTLHLVGLIALMPSDGERPSAERSVAERTAASASPPPASMSPEDEDVGRYLPRPTSLRVYGFDFDVSRIRARWNALFPFITAPPLLDASTPRDAAERGLVFADPLSLAPKLRVAKPRLVMSDASIQQLVDRTWTRRDRWGRFDEFARLLSAYHPNDGRLPAVIQAYVAQNSLQPYEDTTFPDPRRWAMLALAADHQDFVDFIAPYVRLHPRTRTTTELLFLLDALLQGSRETLVLLLETSPRRQLQWTRHENWQAYELFASPRHYYGDQLERRGLATSDSVRTKYDALRLDVLSRLATSTPQGYRASDARFLMGTIRWRQGERAEAVRIWREMTAANGDSYLLTYRQIIEVVSRLSGDSVPASAAGQIDAILGAQHRTWVSFQFDRLRRFGYAFSMY